MITWIQSVTQRHHKWVFSILLVIIIIAFVFTIGSVPIGRGGEQASAPENYFGVNLRDQNATRPVQEDIQLLFQLLGRSAPSEAAYAQIIYDRIANDYTADGIAFPPVSQAAFTAFVTAMPAFLKEDGTFDKVAYQRFLDYVSSNPRVNRESVEQSLANNARARAFSEILTGPGYALPEEAQMALVQAGADLILEIAELDDAKIPMTLEADPAAEKAFYEANKARYRQPLKVETEVLEFPAAAYVGKVETPTEAKLKEFYEARKARAYKDATFADIKEQVAKDYTAVMSARAATQAAVDFAIAVEANRVDVGSSAWEALLDKESVATKPLPAFGAGDTLKGIALSTEALAEVVDQLAREGARPYSEPQATSDAAYIFVTKRLVESRIPAYEEIAAAVGADFMKYRAAQVRANARMQALSSLKDAVKSGKSFAEAAKAAGLENAVTTPEFVLAKAPKDVPIAALYATRESAQGDIEMVPQRDKPTLYVRVAQKKLPAVALDSKEVKALTERLAAESGAATSIAVTQQKVQDELYRCGLLRQKDEAAAQ